MSVLAAIGFGTLAFGLSTSGRGGRFGLDLALVGTATVSLILVISAQPSFLTVFLICAATLACWAVTTPARRNPTTLACCPVGILATALMAPTAALAAIDPALAAAAVLGFALVIGLVLGGVHGAALVALGYATALDLTTLSLPVTAAILLIPICATGLSARVPRLAGTLFIPLLLVHYSEVIL